VTTQAPYPPLRTARFEVVAATHDEAITKARAILERLDPDGEWVVRATFTPTLQTYGDEGPRLWTADIDAARRMA
jgi:hypothetical protein